jgi:hypothetical protein
MDLRNQPKEKPMRYLAPILIVLATACATDDTSGPIDRSDQSTSGDADRDPAECTRACRVAMDLCTITSIEDKQLLAACSQSCEFSDDELTCYAGATCGAAPDCP